MELTGGLAPPFPTYEAGGLLLSDASIRIVDVKRIPLFDVFGILPKIRALPAGQSAWHPPFFRPTAGPSTGPGSGGGRLRRDQRPQGPIQGQPS